MRVFTSVEELVAGTGEHLGVSAWQTVEQARIDLFAEATGDYQWIHVDPAKAASGPFGTTVAHGYLTLSLGPTLVREVYRVEGSRLAVNYGLNRVRFPAPVPVGARVRASVELLDVQELDGGGAQVTLRVTFELDGAAKPACVAETVSRVYF